MLLVLRVGCAWLWMHWPEHRLCWLRRCVVLNSWSCGIVWYGRLLIVLQRCRLLRLLVWVKGVCGLWLMVLVKRLRLMRDQGRWARGLQQSLLCYLCRCCWMCWCCVLQWVLLRRREVQGHGCDWPASALVMALRLLLQLLMLCLHHTQPVGHTLGVCSGPRSRGSSCVSLNAQRHPVRAIQGGCLGAHRYMRRILLLCYKSGILGLDSIEGGATGVPAKGVRQVEDGLLLCWLTPHLLSMGIRFNGLLIFLR